MFKSSLILLFVASIFGTVELRDDSQTRVTLKSEKTVKIPKVIQRMYIEWTSKTKYESKLIQSIPVQATLMDDQSLLMTSPMPESKNTTVRKVQLWMEFHNVPHPSKVRHTEYYVEVQSANNDQNAPCSINIMKKPQFRDRQIEMGVDITSLYVDCHDKDSDYQQLKVRLSAQSTNFVDLSKHQLDAFIILQEDFRQDDYEPENSTSVESGKKLLQDRNKRLKMNKRSTDQNESMFVGHVIKEFDTKSAKDKIVDAVMKEFLEYGKKDDQNRGRQLAREKIMAEIRKEIYKHQGNIKHNDDRSKKVTIPSQIKRVRNVKTMGDRQRRRTSKNRQHCGLHRWYVKFEDIGWNWVIAPPKGFQANRCYGKCSFPLSSHMNSTNHAVVQTLMHSIFGKPKSSCCVPRETSALTLLFLEDNGIITLKKYPDMIVNSCACL